MSVLLAELLEKRDAVQADLDGIVAGLSVTDEESGEKSDRALTPEEEQRSTELLEKRSNLDARIKEENEKVATQKVLAEARKNAGVTVEARSDGTADVSVENEPKVYGVGSANSYYADLYYTAGGFGHDPLSPQYQSAMARRMKWSGQVEWHVAHDEKFARKVEKQFREHYRSPQGTEHTAGAGADWRSLFTECRSRGRVGLSEKGVPGVESRALTTGGGATASASGGGIAAFVTPFFIDSADYVPYKQYGRAFANEVVARPLPPYGMNVYVPQVTGPAAVATVAENAAVTETDPTQGFITAGLIITAGQVTTSQATLDRAGPGFEYDVVIWDQISRNYDQNWDVFVLTQALANATSQSWTGNSNVFELVASTLPGSGGFTGQVGKAKATMRKLQGTVANPNRLFLDPARWEFIEAWSDTNGRPVVVPTYAGPYNAIGAGTAGGAVSGDVGTDGPTGYKLQGLPVVTDPNIPTTTTANFDQAIVADTTQTWAYEGERIHRVLPQTLGGNLEVIFQQYSYGTVLQRYNAAVTKINGSGMSAISYVG